MSARSITPASIFLAVALTVGFITDDQALAVEAPSPHELTLTATNYTFAAPDTAPAGWTSIRFVNDSDLIHMAHLVRLEGGRSVEELAESYLAAVDAAAPRPLTFTEYAKSVPWATRVGGPAADPHSTTSNLTQFLEPGSYAWICLRDRPDGLLHFTRGMARALEVHSVDETKVQPSAPQASATIRMIDFAFVPLTSLTPGRQTIRVENAGSEPHALTLIKLDAGKTIADVRASLQDTRSPPAGTRVAGVTALDPTLDAYLEVELTAGDYVLVCFLSSAPDGRSHIEHGMIFPLRVR